MFKKHTNKNNSDDVLQFNYTNTMEHLKRQSLQSKIILTIMRIFAH